MLNIETMSKKTTEKIRKNIDGILGESGLNLEKILDLGGNINFKDEIGGFVNITIRKDVRIKGIEVSALTNEYDYHVKKLFEKL